MASKKFIQALELLEAEKGIQKEVVLDALKEALEKSYKKNYAGSESIIRVEINEKQEKYVYMKLNMQQMMLMMKTMSCLQKKHK